MELNQTIIGDTLSVLKTLPDELVDCVVTSPPYWGLRDYGVKGQIGLEKTPEEYVARIVEVFSEIKRVLKKEGTCWLNLGDSYNGSGGEHKHDKGQSGLTNNRDKVGFVSGRNIQTLKPKDLVGIPWRVAFALQADGWWLRQDIIWSKPNPMPESVTDRCTKSHEYIFLLTKSARYYFDNEAIKEKASRDWGNCGGSILNNTGWTDGAGRNDQNRKPGTNADTYLRNRRSVWTVTTKPYSEAHFATFPEALIEPMIKAGCPGFVCRKCGKARERVYKKGDLVPDAPQYKPRGNNRGDAFVKNAMTPAGSKQGHPNFHYEKKEIGLTDCGCNAGFSLGLVLDPFIGSGTTGRVATKLNRNWLGIELNPNYGKLIDKRTDKVQRVLL
jgi:DNA modification methylase